MRIYKLISIVGINSFLFIICLNAAFEPFSFDPVSSEKNIKQSVFKSNQGRTRSQEIFRRKALAAEERAATLKAQADSIVKNSLNSSNQAVPPVDVRQNANSFVQDNASRPVSTNIANPVIPEQQVNSISNPSLSLNEGVDPNNVPYNPRASLGRGTSITGRIVSGSSPFDNLAAIAKSKAPTDIDLFENVDAQAAEKQVTNQDIQNIIQQMKISNAGPKSTKKAFSSFAKKAKQAEALKPQAPKSILDETVPTPDDIQSLIKNQGSEVDAQNRVTEALKISTLFTSMKAFNGLEVVKPDNISTKQQSLINNIVSYYQSNFSGSLIDPIIKLKQDIKLFESDKRPDAINATLLATAAVDKMIQQATERSYPSRGISIYKSVQTLTDNINEIESNKIGASITEQSVYQSYEDIYSKIQNSLETIQDKVIDVEKDARISEDFAKDALNQFNEIFKTNKKTDVAKQVQAQINLDIAVQADSSKKMKPVIDAEVAALTLRIKNRDSQALVVQNALTDLITNLYAKKLQNEIDPKKNIQKWSEVLEDPITKTALNTLTNNLDGLVADANKKYTDFADFIEKTEVLQAYIEVIKQLKDVIVKNDMQFNKNSNIDATVDSYLRYFKGYNSSKLGTEIQDVDDKMKDLQGMDTKGEQKAIQEIQYIDKDFNGKNKADLTYFYTQLRTTLEVKKDNVLMIETMAAKAPDVIKKLWYADPTIFEKDLYSYNTDSIAIALKNFSDVLKDRGLKSQIDKILQDYNTSHKTYPNDVTAVVKKIDTMSDEFIKKIDRNGEKYDSNGNTETIILYQFVIDGLQKMMNDKHVLLEGSKDIKGAGAEVSNLEKIIIVPAPFWRGKDQITRDLILKEIDTLSTLKDVDSVKKAIEKFNNNFKATSDKAASKKIYVPKDNQDFNSVKAYYQKILDGLLEEANGQVKEKAKITHSVLGGVQYAGDSVYQGVAGAGNAAYDAAYDAAAVVFSLPERKKLEGPEKEAFDLKTKEASEKAAEQALLNATDIIYRRAKQVIAVGTALTTIGGSILYLFPGLKPIAKNYAAQVAIIQNNNNLTQDQKDKLQRDLWEKALQDSSDYVTTSVTGLDSTGAQSSDTFTLAQAALVNQALKIADPTTQAMYQYDPTTGSASRLNQFKADYDAWVADQASRRKNLAITNGPSSSTGTPLLTYPGYDTSYEDFVAMEEAHNAKINAPSPAPYNPYTSSPYLAVAAG